ncbi:UNKNOWN [Stylonychia lemnae]|uniref:Uncharacterized protein n=1 Tax=Stylonychia lemnae TaxID=5949 RepID=A0A077ZXD4_STYLE|nr:UNKNOWN [Stylonychia lemnae]|eukprot:CDW74565.1 UNKNOWN [Stylonychia lemnae]
MVNPSSHRQELSWVHRTDSVLENTRRHIDCEFFNNINNKTFEVKEGDLVGTFLIQEEEEIRSTGLQFAAALLAFEVCCLLIIVVTTIKVRDEHIKRGIGSILFGVAHVMHLGSYHWPVVQAILLATRHGQKIDDSDLALCSLEQFYASRECKKLMLEGSEEVKSEDSEKIVMLPSTWWTIVKWWPSLSLFGVCHFIFHSGSAGPREKVTLQTLPHLQIYSRDLVIVCTFSALVPINVVPVSNVSTASFPPYDSRKCKELLELNRCSSWAQKSGKIRSQSSRVKFTDVEIIDKRQEITQTLAMFKFVRAMKLDQVVLKPVVVKKANTKQKGKSAKRQTQLLME